ncbi:hypothetical protein [Shewanella xiamenensis]|uniref:hypothetical protein n=1 Tax=Shewanella xiamenensis TaxID=332186 RepID=UPI002948EE63|nr:hypothetical protein [Shewanella xiamenensis]MDV5246782.1 hypothetical protein [Shewanella xiamenensis]MDV5247237.1 hypothetical protein [Shewanella xiamenensis]
MAKSNLSGPRLQQVDQDTVAVFPMWEYELIIDNIVIQIDLQRLVFHLCESTNNRQDRQLQINSYAQAFKLALERKTAQPTLYNSFLRFKHYLVWCDQNNLPPFAEITWRQYHSFLWELVLIGNTSAPIWLMPEGHNTGLKESTASYIFSTTEQALTWCGENAFQWGKQLRPFRHGKVESYEAYSEKELPVLLNRLSSYFFQLAIPLLNDVPPTRIIVEISQMSFDLPVIAANTKGRAKDAELNFDIAFNQAMSCGYYLLSYFTAFNTSQLIDLCHPIEWQEDKTGEYYKLTGFKRRANKEVLSFVGGEIHKKSLQFIETLIALSLKHASGANTKLLYWLDSAGNQRGLSSTLLGNSELNTRLQLMSDNAIRCIPYLMDIHTQFTATAPKGFVEFDKLKIVNRTLTKQRVTVHLFYNRRVITLSVAILLAIIKANPKNNSDAVNLKNIVLPLKMVREEQNLKVDFHYESGVQGSFYVDVKYESFLARVEAYAIFRQRKQKLATHYLLPLGSKKDVTQWHGLTPSMAHLADYGIRSGQFFVNLISSRLRETAAKLARRKANRTELHISQILNNQYRTVLRHYSEGNHYDNQLIMSQGLSVIEKMSKGSSLELSKAEVAAELAIPAIKYDELIGSKASLNGVGVACFQQTQLPVESGNAVAGKACFDYESCIKCQYAKLINDVEPLYRLLSFLECMEESWLYYPERFSRNLGKAIEQYRKVISSTLSPSIIQQAQSKLDTEGRHMLWDNLELTSLGFKGI